MEALAAGAASVAPPGASVGTIVGAALGGAFFILVALGIAIRYKIVEAQLRTPTISAWNPGQKKKKVRVPDFDIGLNPTLQPNPAFSLRSLRVEQRQNVTPV